MRRLVNILVLSPILIACNNSKHSEELSKSLKLTKTKEIMALQILNYHNKWLKELECTRLELIDKAISNNLDSTKHLAELLRSKVIDRESKVKEAVDKVWKMEFNTMDSVAIRIYDSLEDPLIEDETDSTMVAINYNYRIHYDIVSNLIMIREVEIIE